MTASTGTFVSCTDYDDDIENLQGQIDKLAGKAELDSQVSSLSSQISAAQGAADAAKTAAAAAQAAADAAKSVADSKLDEAAVKAIADAAAEGAAAAAKEGKDAAAVAQAAAEAAQAAAAVAQAAADKGVSDAQAAQNAADAAQNAADAVAAKLAEYATIAELKAAQEVAAAAAEAAKKAGLDAAKVAADAAAAAQKTADEAVAAAKKAAEDAAAAKKAGLDAAGEAAKKAEEAQKTADEAVAAAKKAQETADKVTAAQATADAALAAGGAAQAAADAAQATADAAQKTADAAQASADAAQKTADEAVAAAKKAAAEAEAAKKAGLDAAGEAAKKAEEAQKTADDAVAAAKNAAADAAAAQKTADEAVAAAAAAQKTADEAVAAAAAALGAAQAAQATADAAQAAADKVATDLAALEVRVKALETAVAAAATQEELNNLKELVDELNEDSAKLFTIVSKRLTNLVFAPTSYIHGIETINFATLKYKDWTNNETLWLADAPVATNKENVIDDALTTAEYYVSPAEVNMSSIKALSFLSQNATNTRAAAPISVANSEIKDGKLILKLQKNVTTSFGDAKVDYTNNTTEQMTIVALKADLADAVLTAEEKEAGKEVSVFSDWARLNETSVTPYIHNQYADAHNTNIEGNVEVGTVPNVYGDEYVKETYASHFWSFSQVYRSATADPATTKLSWSNAYLFVAKKINYKESYDLKDLVSVCDKEGNKIDAEAFGLAFDFKLMDYILKNYNNDETNQKHFAKLDGSVITSTARDNTTTQNRDAIGREPMIQVVLKDTKNTAVVDVRYFKIQWIDDVPEPNIDNYGQLEEFTKDYTCGATLAMSVLEEEVNALYTHANMSREEFHRSYSLDNNLYVSLEEASKVNPSAEAKLGTIADWYDTSDPGQTHNLLWTVDLAQNALTQAEYAAGKKIITAYGIFKHKSNSLNRIVFSVKLTVNAEKMAYKVNKDQTMWRDGARFVNPQVESDPTYGNSAYATTMILGNFLQGYIDNGQTPASTDDLVNYGDAGFVFDETKLAALAAQTGTDAADWTIVNNGVTLKYKTTVAARISDNGGHDVKIQLEESDNGSATSEPTEGALKLIADPKYAPISVPVKLVDNYCQLTENIDAYNVNIMTPLEFTSSTMEVTLHDITAGGSSSASFAGNMEIKEKFTYNKRVVWDNKLTNSQTKPALVAWYQVGTPVFGNADEMKINVDKTNGTITSDIATKLTDIKNQDGTPKYVVSVDPATWTVTFENKSGNAIGQAFMIEVPVVVETKWQKELKAVIKVTVEPSI